MIIHLSEGIDMKNYRAIDRAKRIKACLEGLKEYMEKYDCSFLSAVADMDEPWNYSFLKEVMELQYQMSIEDPTLVCKAAGVRREYWEEFIQGRF